MALISERAREKRRRRPPRGGSRLSLGRVRVVRHLDGLVRNLSNLGTPYVFAAPEWMAVGFT